MALIACAVNCSAGESSKVDKESHVIIMVTEYNIVASREVINKGVTKIIVINKTLEDNPQLVIHSVMGNKRLNDKRKLTQSYLTSNKTSGEIEFDVGFYDIYLDKNSNKSVMITVKE